MTRMTVVLMLAIALAGCAQDKGASQEKPAAPAQSQAAPASMAKIEWPKVTAPRIDENRAFQYVKELSAMGPRPVAGPAHKKMEDYIVSHLQGAQVEDDKFVQDAPQGKYPLRNIVAKYPGTKDGVIVLASHYDTKMIPAFVGANDGGSSTALLLAIGDQLRAAFGYEGCPIVLVPKSRPRTIEPVRKFRNPRQSERHRGPERRRGEPHTYLTLM